MRRSLTAWTLVAGLLVASCASAAPPTPIIVYVTPEPTAASTPIIVYVTPPPTPTPTPTPKPTPTPLPGWKVALEWVPVTTRGGARIGVAVTKYQEQTTCGYTTADPGKTLVGVAVAYGFPSGDLLYGMVDWVAHDQDNLQYEVIFSTCYKDALGSGILLQERQASGWIMFEVPSRTRHLWVDYKESGDSWLLW